MQLSIQFGIISAGVYSKTFLTKQEIIMEYTKDDYLDKPYIKVWKNAPKSHQESMVLNYLLSMVESKLGESQESGWDAYMISRAYESLNHTLEKEGKKG